MKNDKVSPKVTVSKKFNLSNLYARLKEYAKGCRYSYNELLQL